MRPTAASVIAHARRLVGTPVRHQGRDPAVGLDCVGLLVSVSRRMGIEPHDFLDYDCPPDPGVLMRELRKGMDEVPRLEEASPGHALVFRLHLKGDAQHLGVLTHRETLIHALILRNRKRNRVSEVTMDRRWWRLCCGAFAFRGVDYRSRSAWPL